MIQTDSTEKRFILMMILMSAVGWFLRFYYYDHFTIDHFFDRDLYRAILLEKDYLFYGAEAMGGGSSPSTAYTLILAALYRLSFGNFFVFYGFFCLLYVTGLTYFLKTIKKHFGLLTAVTAFFIASVSYLYHELYLILWNPTFAFVFFFSVYALLLDLLIDNKTRNIIFIAFFSGIAIQFHLSNIFPLIISIIALVIYRIRIPWKTAGISCAALLIPYIPYILKTIMDPYRDASPFQSDVVSSSVDWVSLFMRILANIFNVIIFAPDGGIQWTFRSHFNDWPVLKNIKYLFSFITLLPVILMTLRLRKMSFRTPSGILTTLMLSGIPFIAATMIFSFENDEINTRRYLWFMPFTLSVLAVAVSAFLKDSLKDVKKAVFGMILLTTYGAAHTLYLTVNHEDHAYHETFLFKRQVLNIAREKYKFDDYSIQHNIGLIARGDYIHWDSLDWIIKSQEKSDSSGMLSLMHTFPKPADVKQADRCLMAIRSKGPAEKNMDMFSRKKLEKFLKDLKYPDVNIDEIHWTDQGVFFTHPKIANNCNTFYKSFYFVPDRVKMSSIPLNQLTGELPYTEHFSETHWNYFFRKVLNGIEYNYHVELKKSDAGFDGKIYVDSVWLTYDYQDDPLYLIPLGTELIFKNKSGKSLKFKLFNLDQSYLRFFTTPYFFSISAPPSDSYELSIEIHHNGGTEKIFVKLDEDFRL